MARDDLLFFYERELTFLRRMGAEFAQKYPKIASRLQLESTKCEDPHVERLLEGFAFLAARIHLKLEDDFSEISEALLSLIHPHYIRPIPAMSLVEFGLDPEQGKLTSGFPIPRETELHSAPVGGAPCKFRTCYDTTLWPITVEEARWITPDQLDPPVKTSEPWAIRIRLRCLPDVTFRSLDLEALRVHLSGEGNLTSTLYELLCNNCTKLLVREPGKSAKKQQLQLEPNNIIPVGFGKDEGMLPYPQRSFAGYSLLQEYFTFPEKFLFLDIAGFKEIREAGFGEQVELVFLLSQFEHIDRLEMLQSGVSASAFRLGCSPVVNLFPQTSEPVLLTQKRHEYPIVPDARRRETTSVFTVDEVVATTPGSAETLKFEPFYSHRHAAVGSDDRLFWYARRKPAHWSLEETTDVSVSFVDLSGRVVYPDLDAVTTRLTCFNGDLPSRLPFGGDGGDLSLPGGGPVERISALVRPTPVIQPPLGKSQLWRLISLLSLNYLSLVEGGADALRELLQLHNFADSAAVDRQIRGVKRVASGPCYSRIEGEHGVSFARGHRVEIDFDEDQYAGGGVFLFASVLERFLGQYASLNSFCILAARCEQRKEMLREWPPRAGWKTLL
jgi:type VI secretion system protein ImpG